MIQVHQVICIHVDVNSFQIVIPTQNGWNWKVGVLRTIMDDDLEASLFHLIRNCCRLSWMGWKIWETKCRVFSCK